MSYQGKQRLDKKNYDFYLRLEAAELNRIEYWSPNMMAQDSEGKLRRKVKRFTNTK